MIAFLLFLAYSSGSSERILFVYSGCKEEEAIQDLRLSVGENREYLKVNGISIKHAKGKWCGYRIVDGKKSKTFRGVMTDVDLQEEIKSFYQLNE